MNTAFMCQGDITVFRLFSVNRLYGAMFTAYKPVQQRMVHEDNYG